MPKPKKKSSQKKPRPKIIKKTHSKIIKKPSLSKVKSKYISKKELLANYYLDPDDDAYVNTWILYSLRFSLLDEKVRNDILISSDWFGKFKKLGYNIVFGPVYGNGISDGDLIKLLHKYISLGNDKIVLFTLSNNPVNISDPDKRETHFQSFILVNQIQKIFAFDPANDDTIQHFGIYYPGAIIQINSIISKYFNNSPLNYEVIQPSIDYACQIHKSDVFCQTWSLILQYEYMRQLCANNLNFTNLVINIPSNIIDKYDYLNTFIQSIISIKSVAEKLRKQYLTDVKSHAQPEPYSKIDPAAEIQLFKSSHYVHGKELDFQEKKQKQLDKLQKSLGLHSTGTVLSSRRR